MRAAGYIRVSHREQVEGHSLEAQTHSIRTFCESRDWTLIHIYTDAGRSARHDSHRPAFERMLRDAHSGQFDVLVVDKLDRFYRHLRGCLAALDELRSCGVTFVSVRENLDFSTPWGKLTLTVLGTLAEIYIDNLRQETRKGKQQRAREGLYNGSAPNGYCKGNCSTCSDPNGKDYCPCYGGPDRGDGKVLVPHPIESVAVKLAFEWYATGQFSDGIIAEHLNQYKHTLPDGPTVMLRSKGRPGYSPPGPFSKDTVREILQRRFYTGVLVYYGTDERGQRRKRGQYEAIFPGRHDPLISEELFERCQEIRRLVGNGPRTRDRQPTMAFPLTGLLYCGRCGGKMRGQSARGYRVYTCSTRSQHRGECDQPAISADEIEGKVLEVIRNLPIPEDWEARLWERQNPGRSYDEVLEQERAIRGRWERALELYLAGHISRERLDEERLACDHAATTLRAGEFSAIIAIVNMLRRFDELWCEALPVEKKRLLRVVVSAASLNTQGLFLGQLYLTEAVYTLVCVSSKSGSDGCGSTSSDEVLIIHPAHPVKYYLTEYLDESGRSIFIV